MCWLCTFFPYALNPTCIGCDLTGSVGEFDSQGLAFKAAFEFCQKLVYDSSTCIHGAYPQNPILVTKATHMPKCNSLTPVLGGGARHETEAGHSLRGRPRDEPCWIGA